MGRRMLLVEGKDDKYVVEHLCRAHGIEISFEIVLPKEPMPGEEPDGGVRPLLDQVPQRLKQSDLDRLAVLLDADEDAQSRWTQLRDRLLAKGYSDVPQSPVKGGTIIDFKHELGAIRFGVWMMPDNRLPGTLEDFLAFLVPDGDRMLPRVDQFLKSIPATERLFPDKALPKARIHTFLAIQKEPGKPLGLAITFRYLDAGKETVKPFLNWLQSVLIE